VKIYPEQLPSVSKEKAKHIKKYFLYNIKKYKIKFSQQRESKTYKEISYKNSGEFSKCKISPEKFTSWKLPSP